MSESNKFDADKLADLLAKVKVATGETREIDWLLADAFGIPEPWLESTLWPPFMAGSKFDKGIAPFSGSVDASLALVEKRGLDRKAALLFAIDGWLDRLPLGLCAFVLSQEIEHDR